MDDTGTPPAGQRPVLLTVVRTVTPVLATAITYALAKSNIHLLRNSTVEAIINVVISAAAGLVWTAVFRWLEEHKATWWGTSFPDSKRTPLPGQPHRFPPNSADASTRSRRSLTRIGAAIGGPARPNRTRRLPDTRSAAAIGGAQSCSAP